MLGIETGETNGDILASDRMLIRRVAPSN